MIRPGPGRKDGADILFLAGADRSGIGLLADILDRHPDIAISRRINFWTFYAGRYGPLDEAENLNRCLEDMWRFRRVTDLDIDRDAVRRRFIDGEDLSYGGLFAAIGESHALVRGKTVWGDKSLNSERYADRIFESFPEAGMIHVLRDPRDRHVSVMSHRRGKRGGVYGTTAVWVDSERRAVRNSARYGTRYLVIRYEDLVENPVAGLTAACNLVGVRFDASLLDDPSTPERHGTLLHTSSIGRFADEASPVDVATIQQLSRAGMRRRDYSFVRMQLSTRDRLRLGLLPIGWLLIEIWRPWSLMKRWQSRGPSRRRLVTGSMP